MHAEKRTQKYYIKISSSLVGFTKFERKKALLKSKANTQYKKVKPNASVLKIQHAKEDT
jgi:hypothetical protein